MLRRPDNYRNTLEEMETRLSTLRGRKGSNQRSTEKGPTTTLCRFASARYIFHFSAGSRPRRRRKCFAVTMEQLDDYFSPQVNVPYERHLFRNTKQLSAETVDQFITRLRQRADYCDFGDKMNEQIRDQVIDKCVSHQLRRKLLVKGKNLTLDQLQSIARAREASEKPSEAIESSHVKRDTKTEVH